jgi:hypothetical protein
VGHVHTARAKTERAAASAVTENILNPPGLEHPTALFSLLVADATDRDADGGIDRAF